MHRQVVTRRRAPAAVGAVSPCAILPAAARALRAGAIFRALKRRGRGAATGVEDSNGTGGGMRSARYWEVDLARTLAIAMMFVYHAGYNVDFLAPTVELDARRGGWRALQIATGTSFLFVVGLSFTISDAAGRRRGLDWGGRLRRHGLRGAQLIGWGLAISLVTWIALDERYVRFGILHAIGASLLLAPLVARLGLLNAPLGAAVVVAGILLMDERSDIPGLVIAGWRPEGGAGVDYFPLMPWFGVVLLGIAAGKVLYPGGRRGRWGVRLAQAPPRWLTAPGRRSLAIYLAHQPVLIGATAGALALLGVEWDWPD